MVKENKIFFSIVIVFLVFSLIITLNFVSAASCWLYTTNSTCSVIPDCFWRNDTWGSSCMELNCWSLPTQTQCTTTSITGKNCTWQAGTTSYWCEKQSCWSLSGTNASYCENNSKGLGCQWNNFCYSSGTGSASCWSYQTQSSCLNVTGCSWGQCSEKGCWYYATNTTCNSGKDSNGRNCTWESTYASNGTINGWCECNPSTTCTASCWSYDNATCSSNSANGCRWRDGSCNQNGCWKYNQTICANTSFTNGLNCQWKWSSCQDVDCYTYDYTNATACLNNTANLSCTWDGQWCKKQDCWSSTTSQTCNALPGCLWRASVSSGWCQEVNCYNWDFWNGGNQTVCVNNSYNLPCTWSVDSSNSTRGYCYRNMNTVSCSNKTTERDCMDTYYCWWQYNNPSNPALGGNCTNPGAGGAATNNSILNEWNPKCFVFDNNATDCNNTLGCNHTGAKCVELGDAYGINISLNGIACAYINNSQLCNGVSILSSCCSWQNSSCTQNKMSTGCWDQMKQKTETSCEDAKTKLRCDEISNSPWYMPCNWTNSTSKCEFKAFDVFGNTTGGGQSIALIDNKKNCEAAGGKWITENYCEGNVSVPAGRCEYKFDEENNCDKACFACELKDSNGVSVNATNAETACKGSSLGFCEFNANTNAPNGIGYCKANNQYKKGIATDCNSNCGDCTYKGNALSNDTTKRPSYHCITSKANPDGGGCKWAADNTTASGGYCINKGEKTCEDSCDRCKTQTNCQNIGRTAVANQSGSCRWEGDSNTGSCVANTGEDVEICWDGVDNNNNGLIDCADAGCYSDSYCGFSTGSCSGWTTNTTCIANDCEWITDNWGSWCDVKGSQCWKYNQNNSECNGGIRTASQVLNISTARLPDNNNINLSKTFSLSNLGTGWVVDSIVITNASGTNLLGNFSVNYTSQTINFSNNSFMVSKGGLGNLTNVTYQYYSRAQTCQWNNGTTGCGSSSGWCEQDYSKSQACMGLNITNCLAANASGCNWSIDTWCQGAGNTTDWCRSNGGWCEYEAFKPKNCWSYTSGSTECNSHTGCTWTTDQYSIPHCEINWSANCWNYLTNSTCSVIPNCFWRNDSWGGWCANVMDKCWSSNTQSNCQATTHNNVNICYWQNSTWGGMCQPLCNNASMNTNSTCTTVSGCVWKEQNGWCSESGIASCFSVNTSSNQTACQETSGCRWKTPGWCDPKGGGFSAAAGTSAGGGGSTMGADCYKYDGNQSFCTNRTLINISCGWSVNPTPACEIDWSKNCWNYSSVNAGCNSTNNCWWNPGTYSGSSGWCTNIMDQCWGNQTYQSWNNTEWRNACNANSLCTNNSWGSCEPKCNSLNSSSCINSTYLGKCRYISGWCTTAAMNKMFDNMESGASAPLGQDTCGEPGKQASVDICGFGMKDMKDSFGFGVGVNNFENSSVCNKEKLSSNVMGSTGGGGTGMVVGGGGTGFGAEKTGTGNETVIFIVYLDTDGSTTGSCTLTHNSSASGYEFRFKYSSQWNASTSKAVESFNAYKCDNSDWKLTDIKLSAWKKKMCSEIGGPMIAVEKADLARFPTLYNSTKDMRISVASIGNTGNITSPTDTAGPGWTTPGSVDFDIANAFSYGADTAKFEDILKKGFVKYEDCFNGRDDDNDGNIDCNDWNCQYSSNCAGLGVNTAGYSDTSSPLVTGVKIEEYPNAALIMYDTNKPANGTLELYGYGDTRCLNMTNRIYDIGVLKNTTVRQYKLWHTAVIYETNELINNVNVSIPWPLANGSAYNYKIKVCDSSGKCSISKCSNFTTPGSVSKCGYCNFVARIKAPSDWNVSYDVNRNGNYEHVQGQVCGPNAGMKMNYTDGRKVNIKLAKSDGSTYIEFLNASLTKTGLNDKVRTISSSGDMIHNTVKGTVGLSSETRDKIINNLHPEACRIKIPVLTGAACDKLYHCDDNGENCTDRTAAAGGAPIDAVNCVWNAPYCEFSTYKGSAAPGSSSSSSGGGGGGGGGGAGGKTYNITDAELTAGYTKELSKSDKISFPFNGKTYSVTLTAVSASEINITIISPSQKKTIPVGSKTEVDLNSDNANDLSIMYESYGTNKATITIKKITSGKTSTSVTGEAVAEQEETSTTQETGQEQLPETKEKTTSFFWTIGIIVIVIAIIAVVYTMIRRSSHKRRYY